MGSYYALSIVQNFTAESRTVFSQEDWKRNLNDRFDISIFDISIADNKVSGQLKRNVFEEDIADFYEKLKTITEGPYIKEYYDMFRDKIDEYPQFTDRFYFKDHDNNEIKLFMDIIVLFEEGKVLAEAFNIEPMLMNWLFRNSNFNNRLAGAIVSGIVG